MARSPKAAEYERVARLRKTYDVQANMLGWIKLDVLSAYQTDDDQLVVFTRDETRHTGPDTPPLPIEIDRALGAVIVEPADVPPHELGPRFQKLRPKYAEAIADTDLSTGDRATILVNLEKITAGLLRTIEVLRKHDGPDWRESIGL